MTTLTNLLKGNFPAIQAELTTTTSTYFLVVESNRAERAHAIKLFDFSLIQNKASLKDRIVVLIDFGLKWLEEGLNSSRLIDIGLDSNRVLLHDIAGNEELMYGLFFYNGLIAQNQELFDANSFDIALNIVSNSLIQFVNKANKPCVVFVRNAEVLELYQPLSDIAVFFSSLQKNVIKQIFVHADSETISSKLQNALQQLATQHILVKGVVHSKQPKLPYTQVLTTVKKANGYSFQQVSTFFINNPDKDHIKIEKNIELYVEEQQNQQAPQQSTFSLQISQQQKLNQQNSSEAQKISINPYLSAQLQEHNWDHTKVVKVQGTKNLDELIQLEGEDVDNELEEDEDLDV